MRSRRAPFFLSVGVVLITAGVTLFGGTAGAAAAAKPVSGGTMTIIWSSEPTAIDPIAMRGAESDISSSLVATGIFDALFYVDPATLKVVPRMATSFSTTDNGLTWTLKLRSGIHFSDGTTLDADSVKYNWARIADPVNRAGVAVTAQPINTMDVVDPQTLKVTLKAPDPNFDKKAARHLSSSGSPTAIKNLGATAFGNKPVGAGPYLLKEWIRTQSMTFVRNPDYWQKGKPYLDQINITQIFDDTSRANTFIAGQAQVVLEGTYPVIQQYQASGHKYNYLSTPAFGGGYSFGMNLSKPPFNDLRVRQAMSLVLDSKEVVTRDSGGDKSAVITTVDYANSPYYNEKLKLPKPDIPQAQKLIDQVVAEQGGKPIQFTFNAFATPNLTRMANAMQALVVSNLKNVDMKVDVLGTTEVVRRYSIGDFQATSFSVRWTDPAIDLPSWFQSTGGALNYMKYSNPAVDAAIQQLVTTTDQKTKEKSFDSIIENVLKDVPIVWVQRFQVFNVTDKKLVKDYRIFNELRPFLDEVWLAKPKS